MKITTDKRIILLIALFSLLYNFINTERIGIGSNFSLAKKLLSKNNLRQDPTEENPDKNTPKEKQEDTDSNEDLPDRDTYYEGWIKYFKYREGTKKPTKFFKNDAFKPNDSTSGIPDEKHFYSIIYPHEMNILTAKENALARVIDTLKIDFIKSIPDDSHKTGGIVDFGNFSEGSCFEIKTVTPRNFFEMDSEALQPVQGKLETWLICLDKINDKNQLMNILIQLKLKKQHKLGVYQYKDVKKSNSLQDFLNSDPNQPPNPLPTPSSNPTNPYIITHNSALRAIDGRWIILQDWGQCTLKCGGGLSYQQLMCIPPKNGGKACQGPAVRTRPCNTQACPVAKSETNVLAEKAVSSTNGTTNQERRPAIVKVMPLSSRPQKYDKCYLKEADVLFNLTGDAEQHHNKIPVRIVMNNKTVNIYQDESYTKNLASFKLSNTAFSTMKDDKRCFKLTSNNIMGEICELDSSDGLHFIDEWDYDFNLFKNQCHMKRSTYDLNPTSKENLQKEFNDKMMQIKADLVNEKVEAVREKTNQNEEISLQKKIQVTQQKSYAAIEREYKLEELISKEMEEKEKQEQSELKIQFENEKKRNEFLMKSIKEKELEDQANLTKSHAEETIAKIKEDTKKAVMIKRLKLKQHLETMKKKSERQKKQIRNDIMNIRMEVASKMQKVSKIGDMNICFNPKKGDAKIELYCNTNFYDDFAKLQDCNSPDTFCHVCCENEFGEMHLHERDQCIKKQCDATR